MKQAYEQPRRNIVCFLIVQRSVRNLWLTHSWMYCSKKGEALKLSTGQSKKPWISFWCRSIVMTCVRPDLHIIFASSLLTIQPRFLILPVYDKSHQKPYSINNQVSSNKINWHSFN
jgi:hypothetical protein